MKVRLLERSELSRVRLAENLCDITHNQPLGANVGSQAAPTGCVQEEIPPCHLLPSTPPPHRLWLVFSPSPLVKARLGF